MISGVYAPCTGFPFFRCGPLSSSTASRVEIPLEFLQITVPDASCVLPFWSCSNHSRHSFFLSSSALRSRSFSWLSAPPSGRHKYSRHPLARKSSRLITNTTPRFFNNELGGVEDRSVGDVAFQLISDGKRKTTKPKKNSPCSNVFLLSEALPLCGLDLAERSTCARMGPAAGNAGENSRGICIILHIQSGSAFSAAA